MQQIDHLDSFVIVKLPLQDVPAGRADGSDRRKICQVVVDLPEPVVSKIVQDLFHPSFRLAEEDGVGVKGRLFGVKHRCNAAADDRQSSFAVLVRNFPTPFHLARQHHRNPDEVRLIVEIDRLQVLIDEGNFHVSGQCRSKDDGAVGRKMELRLTSQFLPFRVDQFELHIL